ncbi:unnamed protein product [Coregonus sp. 'balchen']|nr:unnamed protein product [Coregonus sp. 'balchen']
MSDSCIKDNWVDRHIYPVAYSLFFIVAWLLMRKGNNLAVYLVNLSISDLLFTISMLVWMELALGRPVGDTLCSRLSVVMYNSFYIGSGLLCCISVDLYLAVVYPLYWVRQVLTAVAVSAVLWCVKLSIHIYLLHHTGALQGFSPRRLCKEAHVALTRGSWCHSFIMTFCFHQIVLALRGSASILAWERRNVNLLLLLLPVTYVVVFTPFQAVMFLRGVLEPRD